MLCREAAVLLLSPGQEKRQHGPFRSCFDHRKQQRLAGSIPASLCFRAERCHARKQDRSEKWAAKNTKIKQRTRSNVSVVGADEGT